MIKMIMIRSADDQHLRDICRQVCWENLAREAWIHLRREDYLVFHQRMIILRNRINQENIEKEEARKKEYENKASRATPVKISGEEHKKLSVE